MKPMKCRIKVTYQENFFNWIFLYFGKDITELDIEPPCRKAFLRKNKICVRIVHILKIFIQCDGNLLFAVRLFNGTTFHPASIACITKGLEQGKYSVVFLTITGKRREVEFLAHKE